MYFFFDPEISLPLMCPTNTSPGKKTGKKNLYFEADYVGVWFGFVFGFLCEDGEGQGEQVEAEYTIAGDTAVSKEPLTVLLTRLNTL